MDPISLCCSICSKKPQFSDVSHLLTHVSSKAHLANYFKLQVRSHHDSIANQTLVQYDQWYEENNLARLLSDRMASASRTTRRRRSNKTFEIEPEDVQSQSSFQLPEDNIDPRLCDSRQPLTDSHQIKIEKPSSINLPDSYEPILSKIEIKSPQWFEFQNDNSVDHAGDKYNSYEEKYNPFLFTIPPKTPTLQYDKLHYAGFNTNATEEGRIDDMSRLKGIQWPGMNVFDAASDAMKRQRNQKKDASTFKAMEAASCATKPNEMVFSPSGTLRREREITGFAEEEEDLLPGEWPIPKHRRDRWDRQDRRNREDVHSSTTRSGRGNQRVALSVADPNRLVMGGRITKREHDPKQPLRGTGKRRGYSLRSTTLKSHIHGLTHGHCQSINDEDAELQLSVHTNDRKYKPLLQIWKDDDSTETKEKPNSLALHILENSTTREGQSSIFDHQRPSDSVQTLLPVDDTEKLPALLDDTGPMLAHNYPHNGTSIPQGLSRNIEGIYLVDTSLGPTYRVPYDPLIGGNVLHYRWDWNGPDSRRDTHDADDPVLGSGIFYNRATSSDTTIYQDENENKSCLWLDGYGQ